MPLLLILIALWCSGQACNFEHKALDLATEVQIFPGLLTISLLKTKEINND